jgi:hypothetical protein
MGLFRSHTPQHSVPQGEYSSDRPNSPGAPNASPGTDGYQGRHRAADAPRVDDTIQIAGSDLPPRDAGIR